MGKLTKRLLQVTVFFSTLACNAAYGALLRGDGWLLADFPKSSSYIASPYHQHTSLGGIAVVKRMGVGEYLAEFQGLGGTGGIVQVSAYGGNQYCKTAGWHAAGTPLLLADRPAQPSALGSQQVVVRCFDRSGRPADARFTVLFYKRNQRTAANGAYVWAHNPTAASYQPFAEWQWNSKGLTNTIRRVELGRYEVSLPGIGTEGGTVLVTSYGDGSERCKVVRWNTTHAATVVTVSCQTANGTPVDARYTLSYMSDVKFGSNATNAHRYGGYVWANQPTVRSYTQSETYQWSTSGAPSTITRLKQGVYRVHFEKVPVSDRSGAFATAYGRGNEYCNIQAMDRDRSGTDSIVEVACFNSAGTATDTQFTLVYVGSKAVSMTAEELNVLRRNTAYVAGLTPRKRALLSCRYARLAAARKELILVALTESGAESAETGRASVLINQLAKATCEGGPTEDYERSLGAMFRAADARLAAGTIVRDHSNLFLRGLAEFAHQFDEVCLDKSKKVTLDAMVDMPAAKFDRNLDTLALGKCQPERWAAVACLALPLAGATRRASTKHCARPR